MLKLSKGQRVVVSGILIVISLVLNKFKLYSNISNILMVSGAFVAGYPITVNAFKALKYKILGIDALVTFAVIGALFIKDYWEAAAVTFLFMLGNYLESKTIEKTRSAIKSLLDLAPDVAKVIREGKEITISPDEVLKGEIVIVRPGERIPVDGTIVEGNASVNQASITGESMPINKIIGDWVFSGTVIELGYIKIKADKVGEDTTFARILQMVEEAQEKKAKTQKFLEVFSKHYTPFIMFFSLFIFLITRDLELSLTLLVIACPGALVISTPVSIVAGIGNGAKHGVLIKGGDIIEKLGTVKVVAFDKTGTLTLGKPRVTAIRAFGLSGEEVLGLAASAEMYSEHPLSKAIVEEAKVKLSKNLIVPDESVIVAGQGLKVKFGENNILLGNRKLMAEHSIGITVEIDSYLKSEESNGKTCVILSDRSRVLGVISIADTIRENTGELIKNLKAMGINKVVMVTGDNRLAAESISRKLGLDEYYAELLPEDKVTILRKLQKDYGTAAMVGDGVNDAPALASADLGIAIGGASTNIAMETADVVLMSNEISKIPYAIGLSKATAKNMKQNIYFAIAVVLMLLVGVLTKKVFLSSGMLVHELSVIIVIINAIRLLKYK